MRLKKCPECGEYTLMEKCKRCGSDTVNPHPPKFSPEDHYGKYRRQLKLERMRLSGGHAIKA